MYCAAAVVPCSQYITCQPVNKAVSNLIHYDFNDVMSWISNEYTDGVIPQYLKLGLALSELLWYPVD